MCIHRVHARNVLLIALARSTGSLFFTIVCVHLRVYYQIHISSSHVTYACLPVQIDIFYAAENLHAMALPNKVALILRSKVALFRGQQLDTNIIQAVHHARVDWRGK